MDEKNLPEKEQVITLRDGSQLFVYTRGKENAEPILLIHGLGADHNMWQPQIECYPEEGLRVIAPDMRCHGRSSNCKKIENADWADDLAEMMEQLSIPAAYVAGVSMGGIIAQEFALRYPEKTKKLVLSDTFGKLRTLQEKLIGAATIVGFKILHFMPSEKAAALLASAYDFSGGEECKEYFSQIGETLDTRQISVARKAVNRVDTEERLSELSMPVLVMVGTRPGEFFVRMSRRIAEAIGTGCIELEGGMDPSNLTVRDEFNRKLLHFVRGADEA